MLHILHTKLVGESHEPIERVMADGGCRKNKANF